MKNIYLDHAATTYVKQEVIEAMVPYLKENFGNPSSLYKIGKVNKEAIENARMQVAKAIGAKKKDEIYFTSGGSEADNLVLKGYARANKNKGNHIITSEIEHMAIIESAKALEKEGFEVTYLDVDEGGVISLEELKRSIKPSTIMISIMFANNEIGTIEPVEEIAKIAHKNKIFFHTDAVQAIGNTKIDVVKLNIDALSLSGHKFYGPKGVGALYIKEGIDFEAIINGGHQEKNKRAGTENVAGIIGVGRAIEIANNNVNNYEKKIRILRDEYERKIKERISNIKINAKEAPRLAGNSNISFEGIVGEALLLMLSNKGIYCSSGSACSSGDTKPSHVLKAIGLSDEMARASLRVTFGEENTIQDVDEIVDKIAKFVSELKS